jgi:hypothetical protein
MWQTINLKNSYNLLINNQTLHFNLSAWIGGASAHDDHASVSLIFLNKAIEKLGDSTTIGPVFANERLGVSRLIFKSATGLVPKGTYFLKIYVEFKRVIGPNNNGNIDNIALILY